MVTVEFEDGAFTVDALIIGEGLGVEPARVQGLMREGKIMSLCERGIDDDAGRYSLSFFYESVRFKLIVDEAGNVIQRSTVDFGEHRLPISMPKPCP